MELNNERYKNYLIESTKYMAAKPPFVIAYAKRNAAQFKYDFSALAPTKELAIKRIKAKIDAHQ
jgi:hypothetical protein